MKTLRELLELRASERASAPLLIDAATGEERSYAAVHEQAQRWAAWYLDHGLRRQDRVAVMLPNSLDFAELFLGAAIAGITLCPYHPAWTDPELVELMHRFGAACALAPAARARSLTELTGLAVFGVGPRAELPAMLPPSRHLPEEVRPEDLIVLIMTSGTTGGVKACRLSHANLLATSRATVEAYELTSASRYLTPLPLFHINAQVIGLLAAIQAGGAVAVAARLPAPKLWEAALRVGATGMSAVPTLVHDLLASEGDPPASLRFVVCSSAVLPATSRERFEARFGVPILGSYGLSEAGCFVSYGRTGQPAGASGLPGGCEVRIVGGEVQVRGPGVFEGYDGDEVATAAALEGGWLHTGDRGHLDDHGFLYLEGRLKNMINRGGEKIAPEGLEGILSQCPGLAEVAVFGVPDERLGEEVAAAVVFVPGSELSDDDLWEYCASRLAEFETPKSWLRLEHLPRGGTGKVLHRELRGAWRR